MFKKLALSGLLLSLLSLPLLAQQTATPDAQAPTQAAPRMGRNRPMQQPMADAPTRAKKMTDRMTQALGLDQATAQKVYDATLARDQKIDAIQSSSDNNRAKAQSLKTNADEYKAKLQGILTPDQFTKLELMRKQMRHGRRGPGSPDGGNNDNTK